MPKVLIVSGSAYALGGMERVTQRLGRGLTAHGFSVEVIIPNAGIVEELQQWFLKHGSVATASDQLADLPRKGLRGILPLADLLRSRRADVINLHSPGHHIPVGEVVAARLAGARVITTIHGYDPERSSGIPERLRNRIIGSLLNDRIVAPTHLVRQQQLAKGVAPGKLALIYCGVEVPVARPSRHDARESLGIADDSFVVVSFGRLVPDKGIDILIEAVNDLSPDLRARLRVFIGGLGDRPAYERLVAGHNREIVRFLGHVSDTGSYYAAADLFALPSRHEPFGLVFVEAAQFGVPSVGTRVGGIPEAVQDRETGLLVAPSDPGQLRDAIELLSRDEPLRIRLGAAAQRRARAMFCEDTMVARYADLYRSVLRQ
jgi:glycosyltransferase involved in cell wall biosynthesis